jgi:hypothetical protein
MIMIIDDTEIDYVRILDEREAEIREACRLIAAGEHPLLNPWAADEPTTPRPTLAGMADLLRDLLRDLPETARAAAYQRAGMY